MYHLIHFTVGAFSVLFRLIFQRFVEEIVMRTRRGKRKHACVDEEVHMRAQG